jgi:hypothetical protein
VASLLNDVSPDALRLVNILMDYWVRADQWPSRQYVVHEMGAAQSRQLPGCPADALRSAL